MFRDIIAKKIKLIDYERLATKEGRILGFGKHAGIVGCLQWSVNLWARSMVFFTLKPAHEMRVYQDLVNELQKVRIPEIRIMLTGSGRVAQGAIQLLTDAGVKQIDPKGFLGKRYYHQSHICKFGAG